MRTTREIYLPVSAATAFYLARLSGLEQPFFSITVDDPSQLRLEFDWYLGRMRVSVAVSESVPGQSTLRYEAYFAAILDPGNATGKCLDRVEQHLLAHYHASVNGVPAPPPPTENTSKANLVAFGGCLAVMLLAGAVVFFLLIFLLVTR